MKTGSCLFEMIILQTGRRRLSKSILPSIRRKSFRLRIRLWPAAAPSRILRLFWHGYAENMTFSILCLRIRMMYGWITKLKRACTLCGRKNHAACLCWFIWIGTFGKILCLEEPTILYRQHANNVVGATRVNSASFVIRRLLGNNHVRRTLKIAVDQASAFPKYYAA